MRKNQYEEALFRCEDDRYELDMAIEQNMSAIRVRRVILYGTSCIKLHRNAAHVASVNLCWTWPYGKT